MLADWWQGLSPRDEWWPATLRDVEPERFPGARPKFSAGIVTAYPDLRDAFPIADGPHAPRTKRAEGLYTTPDPLTRHLFDAIGVGGRVLDPACGSGAFLRVAATRMLAAGKSIVGRIFGCDTDPAALDAAEIVVLAAMMEAKASDEAMRSAVAWLDEALIVADARSVGQVGNEPDVWLETIARGGFDAVVANPPWISYGGRHAVARAGDEESSASGWPSLHGAITAHIAAGLSRDRIGLVLPASVAHQTGYTGVRMAVVATHRLREIRFWGEGVFAGVNAPTVTIIATREGPDTPARLIREDGSEHEIPCDARDWWATNRTVPAEPVDRDRFVSLGKLVRDCGVHTGNSAKLLVADEAGPEGEWEPVLEGRCVQPFDCEEPRRWLRTDLTPEGSQRFRVPARRMMGTVPYLIRQTASHPIVGPHRFTPWFRNSLLALDAPPLDAKIDVRYLVGLLNSEWIRQWFQAASADVQQRTFPQIKIGALRGIPIIDPHSIANETCRAAVKQVAAMVSVLERNPANDDAQAAMDAAVARLYADVDMAALPPLDPATARALA